MTELLQRRQKAWYIERLVTYRVGAFVHDFLDELVHLGTMPREELSRMIRTLEDEMHLAAKELQFEVAARLRDEIKEIKRELRMVSELVPGGADV